ncbi:MAG: ribonuclease P protein component [Woeseiaceae bacterium]|nr:ribonuclease P protein component [Woeseiaceae bacterium]
MESRLRFTKEHRLLAASDYSRVFDRPKRSHDKLFTVLCRKRPTGNARLGLAISKKHCRHATARNRIKRVARESFRQHQHLLKSVDIVVINKPAAAKATNQQLFDSLSQHWKRCAGVSS